MKRSREYMTWTSMRHRCNCPTAGFYERYGGRGIRVCKRWDKFANFLADMGPKPHGMELDRINNDGDYKPSNCRWATRREQMRNVEYNHLTTINGVTRCTIEWAEIVGISQSAMYLRIKLGRTGNDLLMPKRVRWNKGATNAKV